MVWNDTKLKELYAEQLQETYGHLEHINGVSIDLALGKGAEVHHWPLHYKVMWHAIDKILGSLEGCDAPYWLRYVSHYGLKRFAKKSRRINLDSGYWLKPGEMILLHTEHPVTIPVNAGGLLTLKSSRGREGYNHALAGWFDAGFVGDGVFEVYAHAFPVFIEPGMKFAQLIYLDAYEPETPYNGHYQHQQGPQRSWCD